MKAVLKGSAVGMTWGIMNCNMGRGRCLRQFFLMAPHCAYASSFHVALPSRAAGDANPLPLSVMYSKD